MFSNDADFQTDSLVVAVFNLEMRYIFKDDLPHQ